MVAGAIAAVAFIGNAAIRSLQARGRDNLPVVARRKLDVGADHLILLDLLILRDRRRMTLVLGRGGSRSDSAERDGTGDAERCE